MRPDPASTARSARDGERLAPALALVLALLPVLLIGSCRREPPDERPRIALVVIDTLRADHVGAYGHVRPTTPAIDALASEGTLFRRAYSHSGWTLPSFASLLTGLLPHEHRVGRDPLDRARFGTLPAEATTLAERFTAAGYRSGAVVNNTFLAPEFGLQQGFDALYDYRGANNADARSAEEAVDIALGWLERQDGHAWFLLLHLMEPHLDYDPPASVRGTFVPEGPAPVPLPFAAGGALSDLRHGRARLTAEQLDYVERLYDEEILAADRAIGRFLAALGERPDRDRTVVVVTADHGEEFFDHGGFEHGHALWSELTRVPLVVRAPGLLAPGTVVDAPVQHADLHVFLQGLALGEVAAGSASAAGAVDLRELAQGPAAFANRPLVAENVLYGPPRVALSRGELRLHMELAARTAQVFRVDANGDEAETLQGEELREAVESLGAELRRIRGDLAPVSAVAGPRIPDGPTFNRLKDLGYLGEE